MATIRQKRLAKVIIENAGNPNPRNKKELLVSAGYAEGTAIAQPQREISAVGVREALEEQGFTEDNARRVITRILNHGKEENQVRAADMIFKVHGSYAAEKHVSLIAEVGATDKLQKLADRLRLASNGTLLIPKGESDKQGEKIPEEGQV